MASTSPHLHTDASTVIAALRETDARSGGLREAWTDGWAAERGHLDARARAIGDRVRIERDAFANTWYVLPGRRAEMVLVSSHSDCVPGGGWLDGILGVHAGLGLLAAVAAGAERERTLAVVDWADEEGTRFGRSLLGSAAATGALRTAEFAALTTPDGTPAAAIVAPYGFAAERLGSPDPRLATVVGAVELHIEQGPRLETSGRPVSAVSGCLGVRRRRLQITGTPGHAGALPMADRRDPVRAGAELIAALFAAAERCGGLATAGELVAEPALITAVPARLRLGLDLRHHDRAALDALDARLTELAGDAACPVAVSPVYDQQPVGFDSRLVAAARAVTGGGEALVSGPLHDSASLARAGIPAVMLFVASRGGVSHTRAEDSADADLVAGIGALDGLVGPLLDEPGGGA